METTHRTVFIRVTKTLLFCQVSILLFAGRRVRVCVRVQSFWVERDISKFYFCGNFTRP